MGVRVVGRTPMDVPLLAQVAREPVRQRAQVLVQVAVLQVVQVVQAARVVVRGHAQANVVVVLVPVAVAVAAVQVALGQARRKTWQSALKMYRHDSRQ